MRYAFPALVFLSHHHGRGMADPHGALEAVAVAVIRNSLPSG